MGGSGTTCLEFVVSGDFWNVLPYLDLFKVIFLLSTM